MCKIVTLTNTKKINFEQKINKLGNVLTKIEKDGFGYATVGEKGVFGEKSLDRNFESRMQTFDPTPKSIIKINSETFGTYSKPTGPMILHGRTSTNDAGLLNCHPMIKNDHYLVHNGVVSDHGPDYQKSTTNDSEDVLHRFIEGVTSLQTALTGYYAFTAIDPQGRLHVLRDRIAELNIAWCSQYDTYIIATTKSLLQSVADTLKAKIGPINEIKDDIYMIFEGNQIVHTESIKSLGYSRKEAAYASKSLGRSLDTTLDDEFDDYDDIYIEEDAFRDAIRMVDDRCIIWDKGNYEITSQEFHNLTFREQKLCYIETPEGDILQYIDQYGETA